MKHLYFIVLLTCSCYSQDEYVNGTNPLANVLPPPIDNYSHGRTYEQSQELTNYLNSINDKPVEVSFSDKANTLNLPPDGEYSQNYKDYLYEKEHESPLQSFEDNKVKFNDYSRTPVATSIPVAEPESNQFSKYIGTIFGLLCVFITFITLLFSKRTKRF